MIKQIVFIFFFISITSLHARRRRRPKVVVFNLSAQNRQKMVDLHNKIRSRVNPPATNMLKMSYDQGLEAKALRYVNMCDFNKELPSSDEGLLKYMTSSARKPSAKLLTDVTNKLSAGKSGYRYEDGLCRAGSVCGSYTQLVWATSEYLGCGVAVCPRVRFGGRVFRRATLVACLYSPAGNFEGEKPYVRGVTCSECPVGKRCLCGDY